ncbi:protein kinase family protein [Stenotrophomonas lacuserhaii]|uniref:ORC-CDC6 family AAA ATPase n=1 Tax=Stenotrophomonas lacuserhaii TaxID=2760084 RepID=UPI0015FBEE36|nr:protein kinase family protein [Stenotrophomonas lacuserhaii]
MIIRKPNPRGPELSNETVAWLNARGPFPETLDVQLPGGETQQSSVSYKVLGRDSMGRAEVKFGFKGFVLQVQEIATGKRLAAKLCLPADYQGLHSPLAEAELAGRLRDGGEDIFQLPRQVGRVAALPGQPNGDRRPWVCFITDWLDGETLESIIDEKPDQISPGMVMQFAETLLKAVLLLDLRGLKHDDLRLANLMVIPTHPDILSLDPHAPDHTLKIIDLGSLKAQSQTTFKQDDDWSMLARCLSRLHNLLYKDRATASRHPQFLRRLREYIELLAESQEIGRNFPDRSSYLEKLREVADSLSIAKPVKTNFHPFDAISAEHLANDRLLRDLFVDHLPWISLVQTREPTVLIGPRGCGKSMVFRYLGIRTHLTSDDPGQVLQQLGFFGVYIGCASDLGNDLLWISRVKGRPLRLASSITTYFNLVLARELLRSIAACSRVSSLTSKLGLSDRAKVSIASYVQEQLPGNLDFMRLRGVDPLQTCADLLDRLRLKLGNDLVSEREPSYQLPPTFIRDLCSAVTSFAPGFSEHRIAFLLDDYTAHRLSSEVQSILNTVLWQRSSTHVFKISSEPHGFVAEHLDGSLIDANREYVPVDAGQMMISSEDRAGKSSFITKLIDKRLTAAGYAGTAAHLIGSSKFATDPQLAEEVRAKRTGKRSHYHGIEVLSGAWTGDVATVLHMLRLMFIRGKVERESKSTIPAAVQHASIVGVSTALRERVSGYHPFGEEMARVLNSYGELCRRLLVEAPNQVNRKGEPTLHRRYRFEMTLPAGVDLEAELAKHPRGTFATDLMHELVRRAIFIELSPSRGKEDAVRRTLRWQLRSSFLPSFGTSLVRHSYIDVKTIDDFVQLLTTPDLFAEKVYERYSRLNANPAAPHDLFHDLNEIIEDFE